MPHRSTVTSVVCTLVLSIALSPVTAVVGPAGGRDPRWIEPPRLSERLVAIDAAVPGKLGERVQRFRATRAGEWAIAADPRGDRPALVQGSGVPLVAGTGNALAPDPAGMADGAPTLDALDARVRPFLEANGDLLRPAVGELVLDRDTSLVRDRGRLATLHYTWTIDGVPVERAGVFVRMNSGNATQFGAPFVADVAVETRPVVTAEDARRVVVAHGGDDETHRLRGEPRLTVRPQDGPDGPDGSVVYRLVWTVTYTVPGRIETWEGIVDAITGELIGFRDTNAYARAVGGVFARTVHQESEIQVALPRLDVVVDGATVTTAVDGSLPYTGGAVAASTAGPWFRTACSNCTSPTQPTFASPVGAGFVDFGFGAFDAVGNGMSTAADRNTFYHLNQVRRIGEKWLPALAFLDTTITSNVNIEDTCNAVYNGAVNFFRAGNGCNNTGLVSDVVQHEWGHGLDINTRSGDGATGEGTADIVAMHMTQSPLVGPGFRTDGSPVRNIDSSTSSRGFLTTSNIGSVCPTIGNLGPLGYQVHCEGEIIGQTAWELSQTLVARHGYHTGWRTSERLFFTSLPDQGSYLGSSSFSIYSAMLNADDDDGDLANGTPNASLIYSRFAAHGIANGTAPTETPQCARPAQPALTVLAGCDAFDLNWTDVPEADAYEVFRGEVRETQALFPVASLPSGTTAWTDTGVAPGMDYWYVVMAVDTGGCESTIENLQAARLDDQPMLGLVAAVVDDVPRGNRSGWPDPDEEVDVYLSLGNFGTVASSLTAGVVVPETPGVTMLAGASAFDDLAYGVTASALDPIRFVADGQQVACGDRLRFRFDPDEASGCATSASWFDVVLGEPQDVYTDRFEVDAGWTFDDVNSTATTGHWVRVDPSGTGFQPEDDVTPDGTDCWVTGDAPGGGDGADDVDGGVSILNSPTIDLSSVADARLRFHRWYANSNPGSDSGDFFRVEISDDDGASWTLIDAVDGSGSEPVWREIVVDLPEVIALTDQVRLRVMVADGTASGSVIEGALDDVIVETFVCDDTPACFDEPTFAGADAAVAGASCAETTVVWTPAETNCINGAIAGYNVYRDTDPAFEPGPASLVAAGVTNTSFADALLEPGQTYHYVVRAIDTRSGEDGNTVRRTVVAPQDPDVAAPSFAGLASAAAGEGCADTVLQWTAAAETCSGPVAYEVHRSTDPAFVPGPATRVGTTLDTIFVDVAPDPGVEYTYVVRARDDAGNEDGNLATATVRAGILDDVLFRTEFEADDAGWAVVAPNDATAGNWEWGDPVGTAYQSEDDATPAGLNAWVTGLATTPSNGDVDGGTTTLISQAYDTTALADPVVRYARWFTNDRGSSPGLDPFRVEVTVDNGANWTLLEEVNAGTPLAWVPVEIGLAGVAVPSPTTRFRFTAQDLGEGSLVEAGIDDFEIVDRDAGCLGCPLPVAGVGAIAVDRIGDDVVIDWTADPVAAERFAVFAIEGGDFSTAVRIATVDGRTFVHAGAAAGEREYRYRVVAVDECGNESPLP